MFEHIISSPISFDKNGIGICAFKILVNACGEVILYLLKPFFDKVDICFSSYNPYANFQKCRQLTVLVEFSPFTKHNNEICKVKQWFISFMLFILIDIWARNCVLHIIQWMQRKCLYVQTLLGSFIDLANIFQTNCNADARYSFLWTGLCGHSFGLEDGKSPILDGFG